MPRILLAWEFGGDLGHVRRAVGIARRLRDRGHEPVLAFGDLGSLARVASDGIEAMQAPLLPPRVNLDPTPPNASAILLNLGFEDAAGLTGALLAWTSLLRLVQPRLVVADYAPTAQLAARIAGLPCAAIGSGFSTPPIGDPMPALRPWAPSDARVLGQCDARLLAAIAEAMRRAAPRAPPPLHASELFQADVQLVCTWPEIDPFGPRDHVEYLGPQRDEAPAATVGWESSVRPRIFAYLKPRDERFGALVAAICGAAGEAVIAAPGIGRAAAIALSRDGLRVLNEPVVLDAILPAADLCVSHGGPGIVAAASAHGVRQALLPLNLEQYLVARRSSETSLSRILRVDERDVALGEWLRDALAIEGPRPPAARVPLERGCTHRAPHRDLAMARIALAWELGNSIGHTLSCAGLARSLHARGHQIAFIMRELAPLALLPEAQGWDVFQSPRTPREGLNAGVPSSYAEILLGCGYRDARELTGLLGAWRALLARWRPDLLVADFAPTALLAASTLGLRRVTYGNGFFTPPRQSPLPPFRIEGAPNAAAVAAADAAAHVQVNAALNALGLAPLGRLAELFDVDEDFLCTFPELDHYGSRGVTGYWGPRLRTDLGNPMPWPEGNGKHVLVYVQASLPQLDALIACLASSPHKVIAYVPGLHERQRARLAARNRVVIDRPMRLDLALPRCDLLVCHGGEIAGGALASGVPVLLFPRHYEQYLTSRRIEQLGVGGWVAVGSGAADVDTALRTLTGEPRFQAAARAFARRYPAYSPMEQRRRIVARIEELLAHPPASPILPASAPRKSP